MKASLAEIARDLAVSRVWTWLPGMAYCRWAPGKGDHLKREGRVPDPGNWREFAGFVGLCGGIVPDLTDAVTADSLMSVASKAWNGAAVAVTYNALDDLPWRVEVVGHIGVNRFFAEARTMALARATVRAPVPMATAAVS